AFHPRKWSGADAAQLEELAAVGGEMLTTLAAARREGPPPVLDDPRRTPTTSPRADSAQYRALARSLPDGIVVLFDLDLRITLAGGASLAEAGYTDVEGKLLAEVFPLEVVARCMPWYRAALAGTPSL